MTQPLAMRAAAPAAGVLLFLAACSGGGDGGRTAPEAGTGVTVTETEYNLRLSRDFFPPGEYTFTADNVGRAPHALAISGPGVDSAETDVVPGGEQARLTVTLSEGTYRLWCPVSGHEQLGMEAHIEVGGQANQAPSEGGGSPGGY
ncbi:copper-binding protein [Streptomyces sp. NPDC052236]|uniref:copper-binding protein n=1 Tax=Streptomyces sp. NPDC052236 TaxID=3365686 RepID=UPI0037D89A9F